MPARGNPFDSALPTRPKDRWHGNEAWPVPGRRRRLKDAAEVHPTRYGPVKLELHSFRLDDVPGGDHVLFCVRDPVARYLSGFYSRLHKGQPHYSQEWSAAEARVFEAFRTPQRLASALHSPDAEERKLAQWSMEHIGHLRPMERQLGPPKNVKSHLDQIVYIGRQETLDDDWAKIKALLGLDEGVKMPIGRKRAHRQDDSLDRRLDDAQLAALREHYAPDFKIVEYCEKLRARNGWGPAAKRGQHRLARFLPRS